MSCEKCRDIHEAQKSGLTQAPCLCSCHPTHVCPTWYPYTTNPYPISYPNSIWCQTTPNTFTLSSTCGTNMLPYNSFTINPNNHTTCGSGCSHKDEKKE